jgi:predicted RNA-binding protein YlxR (DUF448 family)
MAKAGKPGRQKHVPLRTCIACRETRAKRELLRIVRTPDGHVLLDPTSKKSGRGAYLCARFSCWQKALKVRKGDERCLLESEFEQALSPEDRAALEAYLATLPREETALPAGSRAARTGAARTSTAGPTLS